MFLFKKKEKKDGKKDDAVPVRDNPFLKVNENSMFRHLPNLKILPLTSHEPTAVLSGPTKDVADGTLARCWLAAQRAAQELVRCRLLRA